MSRSFHITWRQLNTENRYEFADDNLKREGLEKLRRKVSDKHETKKAILKERKLKGTAYRLPHILDPSQLQIHIKDESEYIQFPASTQDLISLSKRLPTGILTGLDSVTLCLGAEYQEENEENMEEAAQDPYTGRISVEDKGPVYLPPVLGTYFGNSCKIYLYGYVYDRNELPSKSVEDYCRLKMLSTFLHEVAHHDDNMRRTSRGRWLMLNKDRCEDYAEIKEAEWGEKILAPYILETYPTEYAELLKLIKDYGGVEIQLVKLVKEFKGKNIKGLIRLGTTISDAVENLFTSISERKSKRDIMYEFAMDLHYGDYYEECMEALDTLLSLYPEDSEVLGAKADTLIHMEDYGAAEAAVISCLAIDEGNTVALEALCDVQSKRKHWKTLIETSSKGLLHSEPESYNIRVFLEFRINAALHLGDYELARKDISELPETYHLIQRKRAYLALLLLVEGDVDKAISTAREMLKEERVILPAAAILKSLVNKGTQEYTLSEFEKNFIEGYCLDDLI
jgi:tetratricopeptide (TPR) repeat protein